MISMQVKHSRIYRSTSPSIWSHRRWCLCHGWKIPQVKQPATTMTFFQTEKNMCHWVLKIPHLEEGPKSERLCRCRLEWHNAWSCQDERWSNLGYVASGNQCRSRYPSTSFLKIPRVGFLRLVYAKLLWSLRSLGRWSPEKIHTTLASVSNGNSAGLDERLLQQSLKEPWKRQLTTNDMVEFWWNCWFLAHSRSEKVTCQQRERW